MGINAAMLNEKGQLTNIGSWYLGGKATGVVPQGSGAIGRVSSVTLMMLSGTLLIFFLI